MALEKTVEVDRIEVVGVGKCVNVRQVITVTEDGQELSRTYQRYTLTPCIKPNNIWQDTDISGEPEDVQAQCNAAWTDEVKTAYKNMIDQNGNT